MKKIIDDLAAVVACMPAACTLASCQPPEPFKEAVISWNLSDPDDTSGANSVLQIRGRVPFVALSGEEAKASKRRGGDGRAARFEGGWLEAGQGAGGEANLAGTALSILVRLKAEQVKGYMPILTKAGADQHIAYSVALRAIDEAVDLEVMMGSDEIAGAHLLTCRLLPEEATAWHDILFRFNGRTAQLYVDGVLKDEEVAVGTLRDWNRRPLLIGAQYAEGEGYAESTLAQAAARFDGLIDHVVLWNRCLTDEEVGRYAGKNTLADGRPAYYTEAYRPQFHFTAQKNWLNDPNGLVYYKGVYHLFFQYWPPRRPAAYKEWGHAVSTDLVHWEQIPHPIPPHKVWGGCWSGSAVVDEENVSGLQQGAKKTILAFLTNGGHPDAGLGPLCTQCMAYSTDGGQTFVYYDRNPVIKNIHAANRDPKVAWDENSRQWVMSLYMDKGSEFGLFTSANLKDWKQVSTFSLEGDTECPSFIPLPVDGNKNRRKWLFSGAKGYYQIGTFDGTTFHPETEVLRGDYGRNFYAAMTWSQVPGDRCVQIAWMPTRRYPGMPFEGQMNFPTEITLRTTPEGLRAYRLPVREISRLYDQTATWPSTVVSKETNPLSGLHGELYDMQFEITGRPASSFEIGIRGATIRYDAAKGHVICQGPTVDKPGAELGEAPLKPADGKLKLRILVDRTSLEIFGNDGEVVLTSNFMPDVGNFSYSFTADKEVTLAKAEIHSLKSAWLNPEN